MHILIVEDERPIATDQQLADEAIAYFHGAVMLMARHGRKGSPGRPKQLTDRH